MWDGTTTHTPLIIPKCGPGPKIDGKWEATRVGVRLGHQHEGARGLDGGIACRDEADRPLGGAVGQSNWASIPGS
jgi:hypothetical protein